MKIITGRDRRDSITPNILKTRNNGRAVNVQSAIRRSRGVSGRCEYYGMIKKITEATMAMLI